MSGNIPDPVSTVANATGKVAGSVAEVAKAKIQADASVKIAKVTANASKYTTSVTEADEILSVLDRPCIRISIPDPDFQVTMDLSILSLMGMLGVADLYKGYSFLWNLNVFNQEQARNNTEIMEGLAGTVPMDPRSLAILAGVVEGPAAETATPQEKASVIEKIAAALAPWTLPFIK